ncbi:hypothetical protein NDU88_006458 [Pleurodeles waltl]|uniref:Uncharacterized protein n=1 Tax=Pleurodeles waltl TaxID=8319 RepID=A0AAV7VQK7_PLEWA|nr:hypothetical protein NDU88_006458 [Pleurodeles waltl]
MIARRPIVIEGKKGMVDDSPEQRTILQVASSKAASANVELYLITTIQSIRVKRSYPAISADLAGVLRRRSRRVETGAVYENSHKTPGAVVLFDFRTKRAKNFDAH